ncbi:MAG: leucyl/phenylalanyl-tRNA--protein transferase [Planctomycetota bacterium]
MPPDSDQPDRPPTRDEILEIVLGAYRQGVFPMADPQRHPGELLWFDPDPRGIIPLAPSAPSAPGDPGGTFRVPSSLRQRVRSRRFLVTSDAAFAQVVRHCTRSDPPPDQTKDHRPERDDGGVWIDDTLASLYLALHDAGHAHSVEVWRAHDRRPGELALVGGLFGVTLNGLFAGESMFSRPEIGGTDASKVALVHLVAHLRRRGFTLLDTQFTTPHLERFGAIEIPREAYRRRLARALEVDPVWLPWDDDPSAAFDP